MKNKSIPVALFCCLPALFAAAGEPATKTTKTEVIVHSGPSSSIHEWVGADEGPMAFKFEHDAEETPRTFLGVETTRVGATLGKQLGLDRGVGLIVARVVPDSGAVDVLEKHDLLVKFEDQLLVSSEQLGVLVQSREPGATVALTILRGGEEQVVSATLGERKARSVVFKRGNMPLPAGSKISRREIKSLFGDGDSDGQGLFIKRDGGDHATVHVMNLNRGTVVFTDDDGTVKLISDDGARRLIVLDEADNKLFDGPVDTDEQREALSEAIQERLEKVENIRAMEMSDEDFEVEEDVRILVPHAAHDVEVIELEPQS